MPLDVWGVGMLPFFFVSALATTYTIVMVSAYTGPSECSRDVIGNSTPFEMFILWFAQPFANVFLWSFSAPFSRIKAALIAGALYATPCWSCTTIYFDQPEVNIGPTQFGLMIAGSLMPAILFAVLDRKLKRDNHG